MIFEDSELKSKVQYIFSKIKAWRLVSVIITWGSEPDVLGSRCIFEGLTLTFEFLTFFWRSSLDVLGHKHFSEPRNLIPEPKYLFWRSLSQTYFSAYFLIYFLLISPKIYCVASNSFVWNVKLVQKHKWEHKLIRCCFFCLILPRRQSWTFNFECLAEDDANHNAVPRLIFHH